MVLVEEEGLKRVAMKAAKLCPPRTPKDAWRVVRLWAEEGQLYCQGGGAEVRGVFVTACDGDLSDVAVSAPLLAEFVNVIDADVEIDVLSNGHVRMKSGTTERAFPTYDISECLPRLEYPEGEHSTIDGETFKRIKGPVARCREEFNARYPLRGVTFGQGHAVALDNVVLATLKADIAGDKTWVVPPEALAQVDCEGPIHFHGESDHLVRFETDCGDLIEANLYTGKPPKWQRVLGKETSGTASVAIDGLLHLCSVAQLTWQEDTRGATFRIKDGWLSVSGPASDGTGTVEAEIAAGTHQDMPEMKIDPRHLERVVKCCQGDVAHIEWVSPDEVLYVKSGDAFTGAVCPMEV